ncbi:MAG: DUF1353 domain-containing protein [Acidimicrobiia bacterium]|nr:DUF1353 domain-containing protein [Acidimicrobiia bacterium]
MNDHSESTSLDEVKGYVIDDPMVAPAPVLLPPLEKPGHIGVSGFFNPFAPEEPPLIILNRLLEDGEETFSLVEPIGYWDADLRGMIVPANLAHFRTDLTSVPRLFTWLVPRTGEHLPAALVHDGLVHGPDEPKSYIAEEEIDRTTADRIFRSAMCDLGTSWLRRWLVWTAVAAATMWTGPSRSITTWVRRAPVAITVASVVILGVLATIDLFDCRSILPWMGERTVWVELVLGAIFAILIPAILSVLWGRRWLAGLVAGIALALLVHVTVAIALVFGLFSTVEAALERAVARTLAWGLGVIVAVGALVWLGAWAC